MSMTIEIKHYLIGGDEVNAVNARELWRNLESKQQFADWIQNRIKATMADEGSDYIIVLDLCENASQAPKNGVFHSPMKNHNLGGRPQNNYIITLDLAKEFAMLEKNIKGKEVRRYFIDFEKNVKKEVLRLCNENKILKSKVAHLETRLAYIEEWKKNADKLLVVYEKRDRASRILAERDRLNEEIKELVKDGYLFIEE